jgi:glucose/mannose-6-phosphate isomerase
VNPRLLERLREVDAGHQLDAVLAIADHLRDALWRIESARVVGAGESGAPGAMVCGMGGSAIGGDLAAAALGDRCTLPLLTVRGYELPPWITPDWIVVCSSYSGNTEETLACMEAAGALGARRIVATTGGRLAQAARDAGVPVIGLPGTMPAPRAAVGYAFVIAAEAAALAGAPRIHTEIDAAAAHLEVCREGLLDRAERIAAQVEGTVPVIYGADLTAAAARRWKTEVNENLKSPAFWSELPEADHNEIEGWPGAAPGAFSAVFLEDSDQHPRERRRIEATAEVVAPHSAATVRVTTEGRTRSERLLWAVALGDLVSLFLAAQRGLDPTPIEAIEGFKRALG